jgi:hypothetical protein
VFVGWLLEPAAAAAAAVFLLSPPITMLLYKTLTLTNTGANTQIKALNLLPHSVKSA